ncbi:adenylate/guanylate cyclase domain-containing protein [Planctomycetota bacterium]|nr:adenylate/guanylate cyclase domain-containing protein [Planctomycetota bacterium]
MAKSLSFDIKFNAPIAEVWRFVSDTDLIDGLAGMPAIGYRDEPQPDGTTRRFCSYRKSGFEFAYEEKPFTWVHEQHYEVTRKFSKGAFSEFIHRCELIPDDDGCIVRTTFTFTPKGFLGLFAESGTKNSGVEPYKRVFQKAAERLARRNSGIRRHSVIMRAPVERANIKPVSSNIDTSRVERFIARLKEDQNADIAAHLQTAVTTLPDEDLRRMQPYAFARRWGSPKKDVLNTFMGATKVGLLKMRWDVICPHCRGDKMNLASLKDVKETAFCPSCNLDFDVDLDRSLEAVFTPHPQVRDIPKHHYCLGGPGTTPHVVYQQLLQQSATASAEIRLAEGRYRVRASGDSSYRWIDVSPEGKDATLSLTVNTDNLTCQDIALGEGEALKIEIRNDSGRPTLIAIESIQWAQDTLSAGELVADQQFRDLFSAEILAPGVKLGVEDATILFTDLVGSTAMYDRLGDAKAFSLVWSHFDILHEIVKHHNGAIVKTIGDAIMAIFMSPIDALKAAAALHKQVDDYVKEQGHEGCQLKVGLHHGACIAVTMNDKLDYFGTTVNLAARVQALSEGGDILLTKSLADDEDQAAILQAEGWTPTLIHANAKGFPEPIPVLRFERDDVAEKVS